MLCGQIGVGRNRSTTTMMIQSIINLCVTSFRKREFRGQGHMIDGHVKSLDWGERTLSMIYPFPLVKMLLQRKWWPTSSSPSAHQHCSQALPLLNMSGSGTALSAAPDYEAMHAAFYASIDALVPQDFGIRREMRSDEDLVKEMKRNRERERHR